MSQISQQDVDAVFPKVADTIADALGCDLDEVKRDASLINDLGAESIDFLDLVFRLERAFKIKIPRGKIVEDSRGTLSEAEFERIGDQRMADRHLLHAGHGAQEVGEVVAVEVVATGVFAA